MHTHRQAREIYKAVGTHRESELDRGQESGSNATVFKHEHGKTFLLIFFRRVFLLCTCQWKFGIFSVNAMKHLAAAKTTALLLTLKHVSMMFMILKVSSSFSGSYLEETRERVKMRTWSL